MGQFKIIIQFMIAAILLISWIDYQSIAENRNAYQSIVAMHDALAKPTSYLRSNMNKAIENGVMATEKSPSQKILVEKAKKVNSICGAFYEKLEKYEKNFYKWKRTYPWKKSEDEFPMDYASNVPVKAIFIKNEKAEELSEFLQNTLKTLKEISQLKQEYPTLSQQEINAYYTVQDNIFSNQTALLKLVLNAKKFKSLIKDYDVVHAKSLLQAIHYDMATIEMQLVENIIKLIREDEVFKSDYVMVMNYDKKPIVGEPFTARFCQRAYGDMNGFKMKVNGKAVNYQEGFGIFYYKPTTAKSVDFKLEIALKNPFTGKVDNFKRTIRKEVAE